MIQIYSKGNTRFDMNGDMVLFPKSCSLTAELNGTWKLDMVHPRDHEDRWRYIAEECVISAPAFMGDRQLFRIREIEKTDDEITVTALPVFMDCADDCYLMDVRPVNKNGQEALNIMTAGSKYSGQSNITSVSTAYFEGRNLADAINGSGDPTFIGRWGGEILYDNYKIIINERVGGDYGVEARYGKNLEGIEYCLDMTGVVTRIIPIAYNGRKMAGDAPWVDSPNINKYEKKYIRKIKFDGIKMREDAQEDDEESGIVVCDTQEELDQALTDGCSKLFEEGLDVPVISISINMVELSWMEEYKEYEILEKVSLGDDVVCRHKELDITTKERVIEIVWDCIRNRVEKLTLGEESYNYFSNTDSSIDNIDSILDVIGGAIGSDGSVVAEKVRGFLDATKTQLRLQNSVAKKQIVRAILFEDLDPESELYGAMAMGTQGLQIAKQRTADSRDWDWTTAMTANGMLANIIVAGILSDKKGLNSWNLDTGEMNVHVMSIVAEQFSLTSGKTIDSIAEEKADEAQKKAQEQAAKELKEFVDAVYDPKIVSLQAQIDGQIETWYYDYQPTLANLPASGWKTEADRVRHEGDLFYWKSKGYSYRFFKDSSTWKWQLITDSDITKALQEASKAQDTADSKRRIFLATPVTPYDRGDLWVQGPEGDIMTCVTSRGSGSYVSGDWKKYNKYIDSDEASKLAEAAVQAQTQIDILNKLTNNGKDNGIYLQNGKLYISFSAMRGQVLLLGGVNNANGFMQVLGGDGKVVAQIDNVGGIFNNGVFNGELTSKSGGITTRIKDGRIRVSYSDDVYSEWEGASVSGQPGSTLSTVGEGSSFRIRANGENQAVFGWQPTVSGSPVNYGGRCLYFPTGLYSANNSYMNALYFATGSNNNGYINGSRSTIVAHTNFNAQGTISCSGTKSRVVDTEDYRDRLLYCYEMASPIFGDMGSGVLDAAGECVIQIDDIFSETVDISMEYHVFLQKEGQGDIWVSRKDTQFFIVKGTPGLHFSWEIKARQFDSSLTRLDLTKEEEEDPLDYEKLYRDELEESKRRIGELLYEDFK